MFRNTTIKKYKRIDWASGVLEESSAKLLCNVDRESDRKTVLDTVFSCTIQELHNCPFITPYTIGMAYIYQIVYGNLRIFDNMLIRSAYCVGNLELIEPGPIRNRLKTMNRFSPLAGLVFMVDERSAGIPQELLEKKGALFIGHERFGSYSVQRRYQEGAAPLVANFCVTFAINHFNDRIARLCAQKHNLYTALVKKNEPNARIAFYTITARSLQDLDTVSRQFNTRSDAPIVPTNTHVFVLLGRRDFETDQVLFELARKLQELDFKVTYIFSKDSRKRSELEGLMIDAESHKNATSNRKTESQLNIFSSDLHGKWTFALAPTANVVIDSSLCGVLQPNAFTITAPIRDLPERSLEILSKPSGSLFNFAKKIVLDLLPGIKPDFRNSSHNNNGPNSYF